MVSRPVSSVFSSSIWIPDPAVTSRQGVIADKEVLQQIQHCMFNIQHSQPSQKALQLLYRFLFQEKESPEKRSNDLPPNMMWNSEQRSSEGEVRPVTPPTTTIVWLCNKLHSRCSLTEMFESRWGGNSSQLQSWYQIFKFHLLFFF